MKPFLSGRLFASKKSGISQGGRMAAEEQVEAHSTLSKVILYATVISGFVAAYLMYRRGESMVSIATKTVTNPVGSLVSEVKNVV
jgi:hypothetical protein